MYRKSYEVKIFRPGQGNHFSTYLFETFKCAMHFIHNYQEEHGKNWVIELIQEG